jgi:hypothetical protein
MADESQNLIGLHVARPTMRQELWPRDYPEEALSKSLDTPSWLRDGSIPVDQVGLSNPQNFVLLVQWGQSAQSASLDQPLQSSLLGEPSEDID